MSDSMYNMFPDLLYNPLFALSIRKGLMHLQCGRPFRPYGTKECLAFSSLILNTDQIFKKSLPRNRQEKRVTLFKCLALNKYRGRKTA